MLTVRYNYRIKPTPEHEAKLIEFGSYARGVWNLLLSECMRRYDFDKTFLFYKEMASLIRDLKRFEEFFWLKAFDSAAAQQVARDLETALLNACSKKRIQQFPKHKISYRKKKQHNDSFRAVNNSNCIRIESGCISIPKVGKIPIVLHRKLVGAIKTVTVQYRHGRWEVSITQQLACKPGKTELTSIAGYDINSQHTVVGSNGWYVWNPKFLKQSEVKLKQLQRQLSRRKQGSGRWHKTKSRINSLHGQISRQRLAFAHHVSDSIAKSSDVVVFEDLNVKAMQQFNGRMVGDNLMGLITQLTKYKVKREGGIYHEIGRFVKSSGICERCLHEHKLELKNRQFTCEQCCHSQCRDWSSAKSIARTGEKDIIAAGVVARALPTAQQKSLGQTKVFVRSTKFKVGVEKKEAA